MELGLEQTGTRIRFSMEDEAFYRLTAVLNAWDELVPHDDQANISMLHEQYKGAELDLDTVRLNQLLQSLKQAEPLDPYHTTVALEACSSDLAGSMAADSGLLRPQRGREQIEAELQGFEEDYLRYFDNPEHRQILRSAALLRTVLKPFTRHLTHANWFNVIEPYMDKLANVLFANVSPEAMRSEVQQTVRLFWKYDIVGRLQWGNYSHDDHQAMLNACPEEFRGDLGDLMLVSYMAAASVHTNHRSFTDRNPDAESPDRKVPSTLPIDDEIQPVTGQPGTLNRFFRRSYPGGPLRLDVASRRRASKYLGCTNRVEELLRGYSEYRSLPGKVWSARLAVRMPGVYASQVQAAINRHTDETGMPMNVLIDTNHETGEVMGLTWLHDPRPDGNDPSGPESDAAVNRIMQDNQQLWRPVPRESPVFKGDAYACVGLVPGYDVKGKSIDDAVKSALSILSEYESDGITWTLLQQTLHAAWKYNGKVENDTEQVLLIVGRLGDEAVSVDAVIAAFSEVAADLSQRRYLGGVRNVGRVSMGEVRERVFAMGG